MQFYYPYQYNYLNTSTLKNINDLKNKKKKRAFYKKCPPCATNGDSTTQQPLSPHLFDKPCPSICRPGS